MAAVTSILLRTILYVMREKRPGISMMGSGRYWHPRVSWSVALTVNSPASGCYFVIVNFV